ncbi:hypothetical protein Tco_1141852, partial [Tanacetum coccineum]
LVSRVGSVGKPLHLKTEVKGSIFTPCKAGGPLEAASLPSDRDKATSHLLRYPVEEGLILREATYI